MYSIIKKCLVLVALLATPASGQQIHQDTSALHGNAEAEAEAANPAERILESLSDSQLRLLAAEVLERNPNVAAIRAKARAAKLKAPQARGLPDPVASATAFAKSPETRTGPQILTASFSQALPWHGKRGLKEQVALAEAIAVSHEVEGERLQLVTRVRRLYYELRFLERYKAITLDYVDHLRQHEEISRSRYATGTGSTQDVVKIQAEITQAESLVLGIDRRRVVLEAEMNALRDRPATIVIASAVLPVGKELDLDYPLLSAQAATMRPEIAASDARIEKAILLGRLAEKEYKPDFRVGATYTWVEPRDDVAGRLMPPEGNGDDIFGIQGGISIPVWRKKRAAAVEEAAAHEMEAREAKRELLAGIVSRVGDLLQQIPLTWQQLRLFEDILIVQAEESVQSGQSGYVAGNLNALDLLDAEHVLFEAHTAIARARADYAIRTAELEGEVGEPVQLSTQSEQ